MCFYGGIPLQHSLQLEFKGPVLGTAKRPETGLDRTRKVWMVVLTASLFIMTLGYLTFQHKSGLSYNVLDPFHLPIVVMATALVDDDVVYVFGGCGAVSTNATWVT
jgi:hypothetical protein